MQLIQIEYSGEKSTGYDIQFTKGIYVVCATCSAPLKGGRLISHVIIFTHWISL